MQNGKLSVPDRPIVPFIEGDGTGADIWRASKKVLDSAVAKAYGGKREIAWKEVLAGQSMPGKGWNTSGPEDSVRRSVYIHVKRSLRVPIIESFDAGKYSHLSR